MPGSRGRSTRTYRELRGCKNYHRHVDLATDRKHYKKQGAFYSGNSRKSTWACGSHYNAAAVEFQGYMFQGYMMEGGAVEGIRAANEVRRDLGA